MKNIGSKIITGFAITIFIMAIVIMISGTLAIKRNEPVFIFGYAIAVVPTESMVGDQPDSLDINDIVIIKKADISDVLVNQVIVYQGTAYNDAQILIIHRVVGESEEGFITQGDNRNTNPYTDQTDDIQDYITADNLQGVFVNKITFLKPIANLMTDSKSMIFAVIVGILSIVLVTEIGHIMKTVHQSKKEEMAKKHQAFLDMMSIKDKGRLKEEIKKEYMANLEQSKDAKL